MMETQNRSKTLLEWLALDTLVAWVRDLEVSSHGLSWSRFCGSLSLVLVVLLFISGAFMAFYYSPAPGAAYDSVDYAQFNIPFGDVVRGVHYYAWNLLLVVVGLHLLRAFFVGGYKPPREMVWISGVLVMLILPAFIITGDLLPWDQKGYWSTQVRNSIMSSVPVLGDFLVRMLQGGPRTGIVALTRFYVLHTIILPGLLLLFIAVHVHFLWYRGISGPLAGEEGDQQKKVPFVPNIVNRWLFLFLVVTVVLGLVSWYWPAPLGDPADPTDATYVPNPEWWVLSLNQLVAIFKGPLTVIATAIIPGGLVALIMALPFIDRSPERHPARRKKTILIGAVIGSILLALALMGYIEHHLTPLE
ncbi:MAG: cytochrome b N-terminal domain-containing protein [Deltaproteobacteria bacterium]|nr:MAG: cytochrome b N-terminal domain-containing protein [Deltaproteobacteria bacterium]